jgi:hypothetical protein
MAFNGDQLGMAIFLLIAVLYNAWFIVSSLKRCRDALSSSEQPNKTSSSLKYQLLTYAVLAMALFDVLWVWLCMIQCWNNTFADNSTSFNQNSGNDSFGCKFMGWYSSFSLVSMMGSHCLVVYYLMNYLKNRNDEQQQKSFFADTISGFLSLTTCLLVATVLFASMPLMQGDGYRLTNGGFCYADFTNTPQASIILIAVLAFLGLAATLWIKIDQWSVYWYYYCIFFMTWILWVPAAIYGMSNGTEIASPYMIIGAIVGHANAIINPILYGSSLFKTLRQKQRQHGEESPTNENLVEEP